jgi:hypothetical protein
LTWRLTTRRWPGFSPIREHRCFGHVAAALWERGENKKAALPLAKLAQEWLIPDMAAQAVIKQFKALPHKERAVVAKFVVESDKCLSKSAVNST